jgi:hypothetical protein
MAHVGLHQKITKTLRITLRRVGSVTREYIEFFEACLGAVEGMPRRRLANEVGTVTFAERPVPTGPKPPFFRMLNGSTLWWKYAFVFLRFKACSRTPLFVRYRTVRAAVAEQARATKSYRSGHMLRVIIAVA